MNVSFLYPLKITENQRFGNVLSGYRKKALVWNRLIWICYLCFLDIALVIFHGYNKISKNKNIRQWKLLWGCGWGSENHNQFQNFFGLDIGNFWHLQPQLFEQRLTTLCLLFINILYWLKILSEHSIPKDKKMCSALSLILTWK